MAEYALVTTIVAVIALGIGAIPDALLAKRLPTTAAKAQTLVSSSARSQKVAPAQARAVMARAPYGRAPLRYLFAEGWIRGTKDPKSCVFAKAAPSATTRSIAKAIRSDRGLLTRLSRMKVSVDQAAEAVLNGSASAC
jgi:hypothetical protein